MQSSFQHRHTTCGRQAGAALARSLPATGVVGRPPLRPRRVPRAPAAAGADGGGAAADADPPATASGSVQPGPYTYASLAGRLSELDSNQLATALTTAIAAEDYGLAAAIRDTLAARDGSGGGGADGDDARERGDVAAAVLDWRALGLPVWLAERLERLQLGYPTEVQRRAAPVVLSGCDAVLSSCTGSGKTLAFLGPALARMDFPPELFPQDLHGPQLLVLVPTFELGVQVCMLVYKLLGGNISTRVPGDGGNMFTYTGPRGIKVRGLLNEEEVLMAKQSDYLAGVHVVVATPDAALAATIAPSPLPLLVDVKALVVDEVDAVLEAFPVSFAALLDMCCAPNRGWAPPGPLLGGGGGGGGRPAGDAGADPPAPGLLDAGVEAERRALQQREWRDQVAAWQQQQQRQPPPAAAATPAAGAATPAGADGGAGAESPLEAALEAARKKRQLEEAWRSQGGAEGRTAAPGEPSSSAPGDPGEGAAPPPTAAAALDAPGADSEGDAEEEAEEAEEADDEDEGAAAVQLPGGWQQAWGGVPALGSDDDPMPKPQVVLVGATVRDADVAAAVTAGWLAEPVLVEVGAADRVPSGLSHVALVVDEARKLAALVRLLRRDLEDASADAAPARVVVFAPSEEAARAAAEPLRSRLWGEHTLSVLLPGGAEPVKALSAFRDRRASLLLATPAAARGLDLPGVSHVYILGPAPDARAYLHRAGRAGRVGSTGGGIVTSLVTRAELGVLQEQAAELGLEVTVADETEGPAGVGLAPLLDAMQAIQLPDDVAEEGGAAGGTEQAAAGEEGSGAGGVGEGGPLDEAQLELLRRNLEDRYKLM